MGIEVALAENTQVMLGLTEMLKITAANQERLIAGQAAAIDKVAPPPRTRAKKDETAVTAPVAETKAAVEETKPTPAPSDAREVSADQLRTLGSTFLESETKKGPEFITAAGEFIKSVAEELGTPKLNGPTSTLDATGRLKAAFFIERKQAGFDVDFGADYDFDGDPTQGGTAPAGADDDF